MSFRCPAPSCSTVFVASSNGADDKCDINFCVTSIFVLFLAWGRRIRELFTTCSYTETLFQLFRFNEFFAIFLFNCHTVIRSHIRLCYLHPYNCFFTPVSMVNPLLGLGQSKVLRFGFMGFLCLSHSKLKFISVQGKALFIRFSAVLALVMFFAGEYQCKTSFLIKFVKRSELNPF